MRYELLQSRNLAVRLLHCRERLLIPGISLPGIPLTALRSLGRRAKRGILRDRRLEAILWMLDEISFEASMADGNIVLTLETLLVITFILSA
jgi:hypothetical protein